MTKTTFNRPFQTRRLAQEAGSNYDRQTPIAKKTSRYIDARPINSCLTTSVAYAAANERQAGGRDQADGWLELLAVVSRLMERGLLTLGIA